MLYMLVSIAWYINNKKKLYSLTLDNVSKCGVERGENKSKARSMDWVQQSSNRPVRYRSQIKNKDANECCS